MANEKQIIAAAAAHYGVPANLLWGVYGAETNFGKNVSTSSAGALGPFQFMPDTARSLGVNPNSFRSSAFGAAKYLKQLRQGVGSWHEAVGHYNSGPGGNLTNSQTAAYIPKVFDLAKSWDGPSGGSGGAAGASTTVGPPGLSVSGSSGADLAAALTTLLQPQQKPQVPITPLMTPSFAAHPVLAGASVPQSGAPAPKPSSDALSTALQTIQGLSGPVANVTAGALSRGATGGSGGVSGGRGGKIIVAPNAERPGVYLQPAIKSFLRHVSGSLGAPITVTTGTNHNRLTVDGNVSDHWAGNAADIGVPVDSAKGDRIAATALIALGVPRSKALADVRQGGLWTITRGGVRYQVIWRTNQGGNHHNHVHIGAAPV